MSIPDVGDIEMKCEVLARIANDYPEGSPERDAIFTAAQALHYVRAAQNKIWFQQWVDSWTKPPTALQVLNAKLAGIDDLPHELMDSTLREIEHLMELLRRKQT